MAASGNYLEKMIIQVSTDVGDLEKTIKQVKALKDLLEGFPSTKISVDFKDTISDAVKEAMKDSRALKTIDRTGIKVIDKLLGKFMQDLNLKFGIKRGLTRSALFSFMSAHGWNLSEVVQQSLSYKTGIEKFAGEVFGGIDEKRKEMAKSAILKTWLTFFMRRASRRKESTAERELLSWLFKTGTKTPGGFSSGFYSKMRDLFSEYLIKNEKQMQFKLANEFKKAIERDESISGGVKRELKIFRISGTERSEKVWKKLTGMENFQEFWKALTGEENPPEKPPKMLPGFAESLMEEGGTYRISGKEYDITEGQEFIETLGKKGGKEFLQKVKKRMNKMKKATGFIDIILETLEVKAEDEEEAIEKIKNLFTSILEFPEGQLEKFKDDLKVATGKKGELFNVTVPILELALLGSGLKLTSDFSKREGTELLHVVMNLKDKLNLAKGEAGTIARWKKPVEKVLGQLASMDVDESLKKFEQVALAIKSIVGGKSPEEIEGFSEQLKFLEDIWKILGQIKDNTEKEEVKGHSGVGE